MRITFTTFPPSPKFGDIIRKRKFLLIPRCLRDIYGTVSIRWLEYANIEYMYVSDSNDGWPHWKAVRFIDRY